MKDHSDLINHKCITHPHSNSHLFVFFLLLILLHLCISLLQDYDMDIYLLMAWRDARLFNPYDKPILVKVRSRRL